MDTNTNITGRKVKNVILGIERKEGCYEKRDREGNTIRDKKGKPEYGYYDNIVLYTATFNDQYSDNERGHYFDGFCGQNAATPTIGAVKIKFDDFESIFDMTFADFVADFREKYMLHVCQIFYAMTDFGEPAPSQIRIFDNDVFNFTLSTVSSKSKTAEIVS